MTAYAAAFSPLTKRTYLLDCGHLSESVSGFGDAPGWLFCRTCARVRLVNEPINCHVKPKPTPGPAEKLRQAMELLRDAGTLDGCEAYVLISSALADLCAEDAPLVDAEDRREAEWKGLSD